MVVVVIIFSNYTFAALNIWSSGKRILLPINVTNISLWEKRIHAMILLFSESWQSFCHTKSFLQIWPKTSGIIERKYTTNRFSHGIFEEWIDHVWWRIILIVQWVSWGVGLDFQESEFLWTKGHKPSTNPVLFFLPSTLLKFPPRMPERCYAPPSTVRRNSCYWRLSR